MSDEKSAVVDSIQQRISGYANNLRYSDLSPAAVHTAKTRVIDTLGVLIGGFFGEPCRLLRNVAAQAPNPAGATIIGTRFKTAPEMAAFVNATTSRYMEFNDLYHFPGSFQGHPSDTVMPVLAAAEYAHASGRDLLTAIVLAYEIYCRICDVFHNGAGFCSTNFACIADAAAAGKLMGLSSDQMSHCIAMAAVPNVILRQVRMGQITAWKEIAAGQAGRAGLFAAQLARAGIEGPHLPFEGKAGWCDHVARERIRLDGPMGGGATPYKILDTNIRPKPCMSEMIPSIVAAEKVAPLAKPEDVKQIVIETYHYARKLCGSNELRPVWNPDTREAADHSIPYVVAAALLDGTMSEHSFDDAHLWNPRLRALMQKIEINENEEYNRLYDRHPREHHTSITVTMANGERRTAKTGGDQDDFSTPRSDDEIVAKFRGLTEERLGAKPVAAILDRLWRLEDCEDVAAIPAAFALD
jgi:2-methylcitrate dehydratase